MFMIAFNFMQPTNERSNLVIPRFYQNKPKKYVKAEYVFNKN